MVRVLHYGLSSNMGGIETYLLKLTNNIDRSAYHFDFIVNDGNACFQNELLKLGSSIFPVSSRSSSVIKHRMDIDAVMREGKYDILHCHLNTWSDITPIHSAIRYGCKVIVHSRSAGVPQSMATKLLHKINGRIVHRYQFLKVAVSDLAGESLFGPKGKYAVINNSVDTLRYRYDDRARISVRRELGINDKFVLGHVGMLSWVKNHAYLLDIMKQLSILRNDAILLLIGNGPLIYKLKSNITRLNLNRYIMILETRSDVERILSAMDCFAFPSFYEGFPNAVMEAQVSGLPCIISDRITREVIVTDVCHQLSIAVPAGVWASKIASINLVTNRECYSEYIEAAGFTISNEIMRLQDIYTSCIGKAE